jgi:hypothetical protein
MDIDNEIEDMDEETTQHGEHDDEWKLQHLDQYENEEQLNLIMCEINHIMGHGIKPSDEWYNERFQYIYQYSHINWADLSKRFTTKDQYIYGTAADIQQLVSELVEERSTKRAFNIATYYRAILHIKDLWSYYKDTYMGDESDTNVVDLIEGLKFL